MGRSNLAQHLESMLKIKMVLDFGGNSVQIPVGKNKVAFVIPLGGKIEPYNQLLPI